MSAAGDGSKTWDQYVFGKLVESETGPVRSGVGYLVVGASSGFPALVEERCRPANLGLGVVGDAFDWRSYPWFDTGGIVSIPVVSATESYILCGRIRPRGEDGETPGRGPLGRVFYQAHYVTIRLDRWRCWDLLALEEQVTAPAFTERAGTTLPVITVPAFPTSRPLEDGWFEVVRPIVAAVVCGRQVCIQQADMPVREFLELVATGLALLPESIGWRLGIGAGVVRMEPYLAIALAQTATTEIRRVDRVWFGEARLEGSRGWRYADWVGTLCASCRTREEIRERVEAAVARHDRLATLPDGCPWTEAVEVLSHAIGEQLALAQLALYLSGRADHPPAVEFRHLRADALEVVLSHLGPRCSDLVDRSLGPEWDSAWRDVLARPRLQSGRERLVASLLGKLPFDARLGLDDVRQVVLSGTGAAVAHRTLMGALVVAATSRAPAAGWVPLAEQSPCEPVWLSEWRREAEPWLVMLSVGQWGTQSGRQLWGGLPDDFEQKRTIADLVGGRRVAADRLARLVRTLLRAEARLGAQILRHLWQLTRSKADVVCRLTFAEVLEGEGIETPWAGLGGATTSAVTSGAGPLADFDVCRLADGLARWDEEWPSSWAVHVLAVAWEHIEPSVRERLKPRLATLVGQPWATVLFESGGGDEVPPLQEVGRRASGTRLESGGWAAARVLRQFDLMADRDPCAGAMHQLVGQWLRRTSTAEVARLAEMQIVRDLVPRAHLLPLLSGLARFVESLPWPRLSEVDAAWLREKLEACDIRPRLSSVTSVGGDSLLSVAECFPRLSDANLSRGQSRALFVEATASREALGRWRAFALSRGWERSDGWRLLVPTTPAAVVSLELSAIPAGLIRADRLLHLWCEGVKVSPLLLRSAKAQDFEAASVGPGESVALADATTPSSELRKMRRQLGVHLLRLCRDAGVGRAAAESVVFAQRSTLGRWLRSRPTAGDDQSTLWLRTARDLLHEPGPIDHDERLRRLVAAIWASPSVGDLTRDENA